MILAVHVKPNSHATKIVQWRDAGTVVIAVAAPATEGKANQALIKFLADKLGIAKSLIQIKRGHSSRVKHLSLPDKTNLSLLK